MGQELSDAPRQSPPKKDVALALLEESSMFIHLDPRRPDVLVPKGFMGQPQLVLQVGLNMAIPIPDLHIDEVGISCTLSFNRAPFWCRIPWSAILRPRRRGRPRRRLGRRRPPGDPAAEAVAVAQGRLQEAAAQAHRRRRVDRSQPAPATAGEAGPTAAAQGPQGQPRRGLASVPAPAAPVAEDDGDPLGGRAQAGHAQRRPARAAGRALRRGSRRRRPGRPARSAAGREEAEARDSPLPPRDQVTGPPPFRGRFRPDVPHPPAHPHRRGADRHR